MKTFSLLKESVQEVEITKSEIEEILSQLTVQVNADLTDKEVEIVGLEEAEIALQEHIESVKEQTKRETIQILESALKNGVTWNLIVEKLLNE